jgi:lipoate-protein ligase A
MTALHALEHHEVAPGENPTGEDLLDRALAPARIWIPARPCLVLGHSQVLEKEIQAGNALADAIPVYRRKGGGGAVLLNPGCLCLGLRFAKSKSMGIHDFFSAGSGVIARAVKSALDVDLSPRGISDLACGDRKVVGCSLYMPRDFALYLASILVEADHAGMDRYLAHPSREPEYRAGRNHKEFASGLNDLAGKKPKVHSLISSLELEIKALSGMLDGIHGRGGAAV